MHAVQFMSFVAQDSPKRRSVASAVGQVGCCYNCGRAEAFHSSKTNKHVLRCVFEACAICARQHVCMGGNCALHLQSVFEDSASMSVGIQSKRVKLFVRNVVAEAALSS